MIQLYTNIKNRRKELKITQTELAHKMGYADKSVISRIENGLVDLPQSKIVEFAKALNTTASALMGWDNDVNEEDGYYYDVATKQMAQAIFEDKELRALFSAAKDSGPEDLKLAHDMLLRLKNTEQGNEM